MIVREQVLAGDVLAEMHVSEETEARMFGRLLVHAADGLDLGMVGRDARADEAPGRGQALDHVHLQRGGGILQQVPGRVEAGRAGADHRDANRRVALDGRRGCHGPVREA